MYLGADFPYINIGAHLDITNLLGFSKERGLSSYLTMIFAAHRAAEGITNFRYRIKDGKPILLDRMCPCFTHLHKGKDLFINVIAEPAHDVTEFHDNTREQIARRGTTSASGVFEAGWTSSSIPPFHGYNTSILQGAS